MLLGALVDGGVPLDVPSRAVAALGVERVLLTAEQVTRQGLGATRVHVHAPPSATLRTWSDVRTILTDADLADDVRDRALAVFRRLAVAEGRVHRTDPEDVHFHEVGALDALADVVGVVAGFARLWLDFVLPTFFSPHGCASQPRRKISRLTRRWCAMCCKHFRMRVPSPTSR